MVVVGAERFAVEDIECLVWEGFLCKELILILIFGSISLVGEDVRGMCGN